MITRSYSYIGEHAQKYIKNINADIVFFSCHGFDGENATDLSADEVALRRVMMKQSKTKVLLCDKGKENISGIQKDLMQIMSGIAAPFKAEFKVSDAMIEVLEQLIDKTEQQFPRAHEFVLYGGTEASARVDVARAVARRAERRFWKVNQAYGSDPKALVYINRLSDYLYVLARYIDHTS